MSLKIKICGITRAEDARAAVECGADLFGLNFYAPSPRSVTLERAVELRAEIGGDGEVVGVFVNATREFVAQAVKEARLDFIQFHGDEPDSLLEGWPVPVIRALRMKPEEKFNPDAHVASDICCSTRFITDSTAELVRRAGFPICAELIDARVHFGRAQRGQRR